MTSSKIYLLLGGNEGDRLHWLAAGRAGISSGIGRIEKASGIYETAAWGKEDQAPFLNQVLAVETELSAQEVLQEITTIEQQTAGRIRNQKWAARTLDIDILFYGDEVIDEPGLTIPHPHLQARRFALVPLCELAPQMMHPLLHRTCAGLLELCADPLPVNKFAEQASASTSNLIASAAH